MRGIPLLAAAYGVAAGANLLLTVAVGSGLGAAALGSFALAVAIARIFYAGAELGQATHLTREIARDREVAGPRAAAFVRFRVGLVPIAVAVGVGLGALLGHDEPACFAFVGVALGVIAVQALYEAVLLACGKPRAVAALTALGGGCVALGCGLAIVADLPLWAFALTYATATLVGVVAWAWWTGRHLGVWPHRAPARIAPRELTRSWRIGLGTLLAIAALRTPILVLGAFAPANELGAFAAVDTLVTAPGLVQVAVTNATLPRLAASFATDPASYRAAFWRSNLLLAAVGLVLAAALAVAGADLLGWLFPSKDFVKITTLMPIAAWSLPPLLLVHHNLTTLAASDNEPASLRLMIGWFAAGVVAQLALVPAYGVEGAAWGAVIARASGLALLVAVVAASAAHRGRRGTP